MQQRTRWSFAGFEMDLKAGVVRKGGQPVRIGRQAFRALALLASKGGELATREELQHAIWGDRVHVDFEHGLNVCIRQVRAALGDEATGRQIVVTCPREGYRLGVPVKSIGHISWPSVQQWGAAAAIVVFIGAGYLLVPSVTGNPAAPSGEVPASLHPVSGSRAWPTQSLDAYEWYWRGRAYYDRSTGRKPFAALPYFERAAALDSRFALAHAGVAASYLERAAAGIDPVESALRAKQAAQRALALDARAAETHVALAELSYRLDDDDLTAEREFLRAVELDGRNAYVRQRYATFLREQRRFDAALEQIGVAQKLDPLSVISSWQKADILFLARRWEEALAQASRALELDPTHAWSFRTAGQSLEALGRRDDAIEAYLKAGQVAFGHLGRAYALAGRRDAAREILSALTRRPIDELGHNGVSVAYIYTGLGEPEKALEWLEKAHRDGVRLPFSLRVAPQWEPLRTSRGFDAFLKKTRVAGI
jgi:DNA-binding winged helix-turn-helix (wHTH) protein/tetratricopeptide (TPR) repeat protein